MYIPPNSGQPEVASEFKNFDIGDESGQGKGDNLVTEDEIRASVAKYKLPDSLVEEVVRSFNTPETGFDKPAFDADFKAMNQKFGEILEVQFGRLSQGDSELSFAEYSASGRSQGKTDAQIKAGWQALAGDSATQDSTLDLDSFRNNYGAVPEAESRAAFTEMAGKDDKISFADYQKHATAKGLNEEATDAGWKALTGKENPAKDETVDQKLFEQNFKESNVRSGFLQDGGKSGSLTREHLQSWLEANPDLKAYDTKTQQRILDDVFHTLNQDVRGDISYEDYAASSTEGKRKLDAYKEFAAIDQNHDSKFDKAELTAFAEKRGMSEEAAGTLWKDVSAGKSEISMNDYLDKGNLIRDNLKLGLAGAQETHDSAAASQKEQLEKEFEALTGFKDQKELNKNEFIKYATQKGFEDPEAAWNDIAGKSDKIDRKDFMDQKTGIRDKIEARFAGEAREEGDKIPENTSAILGKADSKPENAPENKPVETKETDSKASKYKTSDQDISDTLQKKWQFWTAAAGIPGGVDRDRLESIIKPENTGYSQQDKDSAQFVLDNVKPTDNKDEPDNPIYFSKSLDETLDAKKLNGKPAAELTEKEAGNAAKDYWYFWKKLEGNEIVSTKDLQIIANDENRLKSERATAQWLLDNPPDIFKENAKGQVTPEKFNSWLESL